MKRDRPVPEGAAPPVPAAVAPPAGGPASSAIDWRRVGRRYDRWAPIYDALGMLCFGGGLRQTARQLLEYPAACRRGLILGGGTGCLLEDLAAHRFAGEWTWVDVSAAMLRKARRRWQRLGYEAATIRFELGTVEGLAREPRHDAVLAPFFFDQFDPAALSLLFEAIDARTSSDALWWVADFAPPSTMLQRGVQAALYAAFRAGCGIPATRLADIETAAARCRLGSSIGYDSPRAWFQARVYRRVERLPTESGGGRRAGAVVAQ